MPQSRANSSASKANDNIPNLHPALHNKISSLVVARHPFQGAGHSRTARAAAEDALFPNHPAGHLEALHVVHAHDVVDVFPSHRGGHEVLADALHHVGVWGGHLAGVEEVEEHGAHWVHADDLNLRVLGLEELADPADRAAGPHAADYGVQLLTHLFPDLRTGAQHVGLGPETVSLKFPA